MAGQVVILAFRHRELTADPIIRVIYGPFRHRRWRGNEAVPPRSISARGFEIEGREARPPFRILSFEYSPGRLHYPPRRNYSKLGAPLNYGVNLSETRADPELRTAIPGGKETERERERGRGERRPRCCLPTSCARLRLFPSLDPPSPPLPPVHRINLMRDR